jgi:DNA-binding MarR family transcriptional regulator
MVLPKCSGGNEVFSEDFRRAAGGIIEAPHGGAARLSSPKSVGVRGEESSRRDPGVMGWEFDFRLNSVYTLIMESYEPDPAFLACRGCVCAALRRASRAVTRHYERAFRGSGLRGTQFTLLVVLTQTGPLPVSGLARHTGLERTTLTRNLGLLESKGLVRVKSTEADQRIRRVEMTPAGRRAAEKGLAAWRRAQVGVGTILQNYKLGDLSGNLSK